MRTEKPTGVSCPACGSGALAGFLDWPSVPVHSCLLMEDGQEARDFPRGDLYLMFCDGCGLVFNATFDVAQNQYSGQYEETQAFSSRFRDFARGLAKDWVDRYALHGKRVVEIGCGKGEFLVHMVEQGAGEGVGIDPGIHTERIDTSHADRLTWVPGFFPDDWPDLDADAVVCRHTLEHIGPVGDFMRQVRAAIGSRTDTVVLFELPDVLRVLREGAFWDIYYEHCAYFSAGSLARLFRATGFDVLDVSMAYDDQYILIEARPSAVPAAGQPQALEEDMATLRGSVAPFSAVYDGVVTRWRHMVGEVGAQRGRTVIWGSGSKGVAFLAALGDRAEYVDAAVDINPYKHGMYMAGTGHRIVPPADLAEHPPDLVIAMNPAYRDEIAADLDKLGVRPRLEVL